MPSATGARVRFSIPMPVHLDAVAMLGRSSSERDHGSCFPGDQRGEGPIVMMLAPAGALA